MSQLRWLVTFVYYSLSFVQWTNITSFRHIDLLKEKGKQGVTTQQSVRREVAEEKNVVYKKKKCKEITNMPAEQGLVCGWWWG